MQNFDSFAFFIKRQGDFFFSFHCSKDGAARTTAAVKTNFTTWKIWALACPSRPTTHSVFWELRNKKKSWWIYQLPQGLRRTNLAHVIMKQLQMYATIPIRGETQNGSFQGVTSVCKILLFFISLLEIKTFIRFKTIIAWKTDIMCVSEP